MRGFGTIARACAAAVLVFAAAARAEETVAQSVYAVEVELQKAGDQLASSNQTATFAAEYEKLRLAAVAKLEAIAARRRAAGPTETRDADLAIVYEALCRSGIAPDGDGARDVAKKILLADPETPAAWPIMRHLRWRVEAQAWRDETKPHWSGLQKWASDLRADPGATGEAQRALDLLLAQIALDEDVVGQAARLAKQIVDADKGSQTLRDAARYLRGRTSLRPSGGEAPPFRLPGDGGGEIALADLRGRVVLVLFSFDDDEEKALRSAATRLSSNIAADDLAAVVVPMTSSSASAGTPFPNETSTAYGDAARKVADAYGVLDTSALFLVGPTGRILMSRGWDAMTGPDDAFELAHAAIGAPFPEMIRALGADRSWSTFPAAWRRVLARRRGAYDSTAWTAAREAGPKAVCALAVAAAVAGKKPDEDPGIDVSTVHGKVVAAYCARRFGQGDDAWKKIGGQFTTKSDVEALLDVVDAFLDLGLEGDEVRVAMEQAAIKGKDWRLVSTALRAVSFQDCDQAPPHALQVRAKDKVWQVRLATAEALRAYRHVDSVAPLVDMLGDERQRVRCEAAASLKTLTREDFGTSQKRWAEWRRGQGQKFALPPRELNAETLSWTKGHDYAVATYFGAKIASDRVVLLLDKSETMYYSLFDAAVDEVKAFLESAGPTLSFGVIEFAEKPTEFRPKLVPANASNVAAALEFLNKDKPYGPTDLADSMRLALSTEDVDTVVYLSDGQPANRGTPQDPAGLLAEFAKVNRYLRITIHVVWLAPGRVFPFDGPRGKDKPPLTPEETARRKEVRERSGEFETGAFLTAFAAQHGGTFHVAFADQYNPPPGAPTRPSTDK